MDQTLVDFQRSYVTFVEHRITADLDVISTGSGIGKNAIRFEYANHAFTFAKHQIQPALQQVHRLRCGKHFGFVLEVAAVSNVVQIVGQHQSEVGERRITSMKGVRSSAVKLLGNQAEIGGAACFEHADHHPVFLAHAPHDLPDRVELAQLTGDVAFDVLELFLLGAGIKAKRTAFVVSAVDLRQLTGASGKKTLANAVVPFHCIKHAQRGLRFDDTFGQTAHRKLVFIQVVTGIHPYLVSDEP